MSGVADMTMLSNSIADYPTISHGKTRIPGVNDTEQFDITVVSLEPALGECLLIPKVIQNHKYSIFKKNMHLTSDICR